MDSYFLALTFFSVLSLVSGVSQPEPERSLLDASIESPDQGFYVDLHLL